MLRYRNVTIYRVSLRAFPQLGMPAKYVRLIDPRQSRRGIGGRALIRSNPVGVKYANGWKWIQI
jgi:hypothetical protein